MSTARPLPGTHAGPPDDAAQTPVGLAHDHLCRSGQLVGNADQGRVQLVAPVCRGCRGSRRTVRCPATPIATSVCPTRQARPNVSLTMTATSTPRR